MGRGQQCRSGTGTLNPGALAGNWHRDQGLRVGAGGGGSRRGVGGSVGVALVSLAQRHLRGSGAGIGAYIEAQGAAPVLPSPPRLLLLPPGSLIPEPMGCWWHWRRRRKRERIALSMTFGMHTVLRTPILWEADGGFMDRVLLSHPPLLRKVSAALGAKASSPRAGRLLPL